jgi:hypothetical protein
LEKSDDGFTTTHLFGLVDIREVKYLNLEGISIFMSEFYENLVAKNRKIRDP